MKFKELTTNALSSNVKTLSEIYASFLFIKPRKDKVIRLKKEYKPDFYAHGRITQYYMDQRNDANLVREATNAISALDIFNDYNNPEASLKLHISLNEISELDHSVILNLISFLIKESESADNELSFKFKIIQPECLDNRFKNTDQFTVYFDNYSSIADIINLAEKIDAFLKSQNVQENQIQLGPKDSFGFNSFVSARFDTLKLLKKYGEFPFFDLELKKFFERHSKDELKNLPVGTLDAVFDKIFTLRLKPDTCDEGDYVISAIDLITLDERYKKDISDYQEYMEEFSKAIQHEFDELIKNPEVYLGVTDQKQDYSGEKATEKEHQGVEDAQTDNDKVELATDLDCTSPNSVLFSLDSKDSNFRESFPDLSSWTNDADHAETPEAPLSRPLRPKLNPQAVHHFQNLLDQIKAKSEKFNRNNNRLKEETAVKLHKNLNAEFIQYQSGKIEFDQFKERCSEHINISRPILEVHTGWKELFINVLKTITSLGIVPLYHYINSNRQTFFNKVNTDSINKVDKIEKTLNTLKEDIKGESFDAGFVQ